MICLLQCMFNVSDLCWFKIKSHNEYRIHKKGYETNLLTGSRHNDYVTHWMTQEMDGISGRRIPHPQSIQTNRVFLLCVSDHLSWPGWRGGGIVAAWNWHSCTPSDPIPTFGMHGAIPPFSPHDFDVVFNHGEGSFYLLLRHVIGYPYG